jgi:hypothetical protein
MPGLTNSSGQLTTDAINNINSGGEPLPNGTDLGIGLNNPPIPQSPATSLTNPSDSISTSAISGQPGTPGIFTATTQASTYNFTTPDGKIDTSSSSALLNSTTLNSSAASYLPGSLVGVDAGIGQLAISDISSSGQSASNSAPRPNILDSYPTYTYRFSLMMVPPGTYNDTIANPESFVPSNVLIASAGLYGNNTFTRNALFTDDFYFENVEIETIIGLNAETRGSNAISMKFDIIEPYGCTLLNRLIDCTASIGGYNYISMPYIFQIDFVGYDTNGNPVNPIPGTTKIIPIHLISMKINYNEKGTVYKVEAIPVNHSAYNDTHVIIPANFEISASTINDFFNATAAQASNVSPNRQESNTVAAAQRIQQLQGATTDNQTQALLNAQSTASGPATDASSQTMIVTGVKDALNQWNANLVQNNSMQKQDEYEFVFDPSIASAKLTIPARTDPKNTQYLNDKDEKDYKLKGAQSSQNQGIYTLNYKTNTFRINAGTSIIDLINNIIRNSDYMTNQLTDPTTGAQSSETPSTSTTNQNKPYDHWRITTQVQLLDFDKTRNKYAKKITYYINKYTMYNIRYPYAPQGKASKYVKDYQYLFTGENTSIIDLDMSFEGLFYTAVTAFPAQGQATSSQSLTDKNNPQVQNNLIPAQGNISPSSFQPVSGIMSATAPGYAFKDTRTTMAADLHANLLSKSQSDMLSITMEIIGDPDFIKQDDILYIGNNASNIHGSIPMDTGEVDVRLTFKSAGDYDMNTGLLSKTTYQATNNVFNGLYRVLQVTSTFTSGQFTQKLSMVRLPNQTNDYTAQGTTNSDTSAERSVTGYDTPSGINSTQIGASVLAGASIGNGAISTANNLVENAVDQVPNLPSPTNVVQIGQTPFVSDFTGTVSDILAPGGNGTGGNGALPNPELNVVVIQDPNSRRQ